MSTATCEETHHVFTAFGGSRCEVIAYDATQDDISAVVADTYAFEQQLTRFDARSELSRFNASAGACVAVSPLLGELLAVCLDAYELSTGLVNAACLPALINAGYDRSITEIRRRPAPRIKAGATSRVPALPDVLEVGNGWARIAAGCAIDLGGVGKGWLADRLCERFDNAAINLGGDIRTRGPGPDGRGWTVALCSGRVVTVGDAGIATSGTSGRRWPGGHHLIDARTGLPAQTDISAISVIAVTALHAEILAKSACVLGIEAAGEWLDARGAAGREIIRIDASTLSRPGDRPGRSAFGSDRESATMCLRERGSGQAKHRPGRSPGRPRAR
jgi:thiamine biosynthesis lipoprotein